MKDTITKIMPAKKQTGKTPTNQQIQKAVENLRDAAQVDIQQVNTQSRSKDYVDSLKDLVKTEYLHYIQMQRRVFGPSLIPIVLKDDMENTDMARDFIIALDQLVEEGVLMVADETENGRFYKIKPEVPPSTDIFFDKLNMGRSWYD